SATVRRRNHSRVGTTRCFGRSKTNAPRDAATGSTHVSSSERVVDGAGCGTVGSVNEGKIARVLEAVHVECEVRASTSRAGAGHSNGDVLARPMARPNRPHGDNVAVEAAAREGDNDVSDRLAGRVRRTDGETVDLGFNRRTSAHEGNEAVGVVFRDTERVVVSVTRDVEGVCAGDGVVNEAGDHVAQKRAILEGFQGGHPAASLALPGPVVVAGDALKPGALRQEA